MRVAVKICLSLVLLAAVASGAAWLRPVPPSVAAAQPPIPVVPALVARHDVAIILSGLGTVQALNTATVRSQVTGLLESVDFTEGQEVHRGDLLAQVDPRPNQAALDQAKAQLARDQAHLGNAQRNLGRQVPLLGQGFATDQQVSDQQSQVSQMQSSQQSDHAAIEAAQTQLSYTALTAPFDGVTGIRTLDVGNIIHNTDTIGLVVVTQIQPISVVFTLPSSDIQQVQDALAKGPLEAVAYDQTGTRILDTGHLLLINNQADPATGTVQLKALFPNAKRRLWPGVFVNVELITAVEHDALTVPTDALQQGAKGAFVYLIGPDHKVEPRDVTVGQRERGVALVTAGLAPGDTVVVQGQYRLVNQAVVTPVAADQVADAFTTSSGMLP
jgi:multidrug efflux system membrane fusion protein